MVRKTQLHSAHVEAGAKMVDFGGWEMPIHYGSQIEEHHAVRSGAGIFDVSHMTVVDLRGARVRSFLRSLLANDVDKLKTSGAALYSCMLNERGGVIDDLITYFLNDEWFRIVVNAATSDKDLVWIRRHAGPFALEVSERRELAMIAVQGPAARELFAGLLDVEQRAHLQSLKRFAALEVDGVFVARTGYTGEDGFEIIVPGEDALVWWRKLAAAGARPCGLGARDTLRLEAGMNLYGQDMDEDTTPLESGLGWTVALEPGERDFIGREVLLRQKEQGLQRVLVGLILEDRGVLRHGQKLICAGGQGMVTSGSFAPTLGASIALARVPRGTGGRVQVEIRGRRLTARVVRPPFVRAGKPVQQ